MSSLFDGELVRFVASDIKAAAEATARWLTDTEYARLLDSDPPRLATAQALQAEWEKESPNPHNFVVFDIQAKADERQIGFIALFNFYWNHGEAWVAIGIGEREYRGRGCGTDAMRVLLRYAFTELNLHRVTLIVFGYNPRAMRSYEKAGFVVEGRQRRCLHRDGQWWDMVFMGILKDEWEKERFKFQKMIRHLNLET
jgi:RimJ/RimL family protein N-acetyltransferase